MARLAMNLGGIVSEFPVPVFLRWDRHQAMGGFPQIRVSGVDYSTPDIETYLDANMELANPLPAGASRYLYPIRLTNIGLTYALSLAGTALKCTWDGGASVSAVGNGGDSGTVTANLGSRFCTFTLGASGTAPQGGNSTDNAWLVFTLGNASREPPTNIRIFPAAYESRITAGEIFDPLWLTEASRWKALRMMDWQKTNNSQAVNYADLATDSYRFFGDGSVSTGQKVGPSPAAIAALANQTGKPIWVCIPHQFTNAAATSLIQYLKDNVAGMVYYEWSNEVWNTGFSQTTYANAQGALVSGNPWSGDSATIKGLKYAGLRAAQISEICRTVYGTDSGTRWTGVLCTQLGNTAVLTNKLIGVAYHIANDVGAASTAAKLFSHIGVAPYTGPTPTTAASGEGLTLSGWADTSIGLNDNYEYFNSQLFNQLKSSTPSSGLFYNIAFWRALWLSHIATAAANGMTVVMYEGGYGGLCALPLRDNLSGETEGTKLNLAFAKFALSSYPATVDSQINNLFLADGGAFACQFNDIGPHTKYGPWGASEYLGDTNPRAANARTWNEDLPITSSSGGSGKGKSSTPKRGLITATPRLVWSKKKRTSAVAQVTEAVQQVAKVYPEYRMDFAEERRHIANLLLADNTLAQLRKIESAKELADRIAQVIEEDDEEVLLLM